MKNRWEILIVDDEEDIHAVTRLALRHRKWRNRPFHFVSAKTAKEAREILLAPESPQFDVAIVDVVMESPTAGLELCEFIRARCPASLRIVLRTGQPGRAPEEYVLNEFDIDYYLAKAEFDEAKLYSVLATCLRSSLDIATLMAFGRQIRSFASVLNGVSTVKDLLALMHEGMKFLALKFNALIAFSHDVPSTLPLLRADSRVSTSGDFVEEEVRAGMARARELKLTELETHPGEVVGLRHSSFVIPFSTAHQSGCIYVELSHQVGRDELRAAFQSDLAVFIENWRMSFTTLQLQEQVARDRMLREQMYLERLQSIANMVTGVAHEINTPLGVAGTANSTIARIVQEIRAAVSSQNADEAERFEELAEASELLARNVYRAHNLIRSFKQLSSSQLSDDRATVAIDSVIDDCFQSMKPELKKAQITWQMHTAKDLDPTWNGFPGHLSQVVVNLISNTIRYAYSAGGAIEVRLQPSKVFDGFRVEFQDRGVGIAPEVMPRIFDPFVTTGRSRGGTGLGLAISLNIVTNLLKGTIDVASKVKEGTTFYIDIPREVPASPDTADAFHGTF